MSKKRHFQVVAFYIWETLNTFYQFLLRGALKVKGNQAGKVGVDTVGENKVLGWIKKLHEKNG